MPLSLGLADVAIESVTSIEELTDVSSLGLSHEESSTWVLMYVIGKVKHKAIENAQVFSLVNSYIEFSLGDNKIAISWECVFSVFHEFEIGFKSQEKHNREHVIECPKELKFSSLSRRSNLCQIVTAPA